MPYEILDGVTRADVAFRISGKDLSELFVSASNALLSVLIEDPESLSSKTEKRFELKNTAVDMLLFDLLNELIYVKDAEYLLLAPVKISINNSDNTYVFEGIFKGEEIDISRHKLNVDVKAVTMHNLMAEQIQNGWEAVFVLDV